MTTATSHHKEPRETGTGTEAPDDALTGAAGTADTSLGAGGKEEGGDAIAGAVSLDAFSAGAGFAAFAAGTVNEKTTLSACTFSTVTFTSGTPSPSRSTRREEPGAIVTRTGDERKTNVAPEDEKDSSSTSCDEPPTRNENEPWGASTCGLGADDNDGAWYGAAPDTDGGTAFRPLDVVEK